MAAAVGCMWDEFYPRRNDKQSSSSLAKNATCGGLAGIVSSIAVCPLDHVKTKMQLMDGGGSPSSFRTANDILCNHGVSGLYRGFAATVGRQFPGFVIYFGSYDMLRSSFLASFGSMTTTTMMTTSTAARWEELSASIFAGGIAGALSWAIIYPVDLVKTRVQSLTLTCPRHEQQMIYIARNVVHRHGWRALCRGFGITILRAFPVNAIIFLTYEATLEALQCAQY